MLCFFFSLYEVFKSFLWVLYLASGLNVCVGVGERYAVSINLFTVFFVLQASYAIINSRENGLFL
jgi:hypothetical protein